MPTLLEQLLADLPNRLEQARARAAEAGLDAVLVTPGPDLRYLTGYNALQLERLTCLVVRKEDPVLIVPQLEAPAASASAAGALGLDVVTWSDHESPYPLVADLVGGAQRVGLDMHMWAQHVLSLREVLDAEQQLAGEVLAGLRRRKSPAEVAALQAAGAAIDSVHAQVSDFLRAGRTEREVAADISEAILAAGHSTVDFVIVASGPNGASPHHDHSDRVINEGDPVVVDIGGTTAAGYCSDSTRTYALGQPPQEFLELYEVLQGAQAAAVAAVAPGVTAQSLDAVAREAIASAGFGEFFIHRTGHGIGVETHEEPYIVAGNRTSLEPGMAFSVEPGIYLPGKFGARIEDIVVCGDRAGEPVNHRTHDLVVL